MSFWTALRAGGMASGIVCMMTECFLDMTTCFTDVNCIEAFECVAECDPAQPGCDLNCEVEHGMTHSIKKFTDLSNCIFGKKCIPQYPDDGKCRVNYDTDGQKNLTTMDTIYGSWWVTKGLNPHYDNFPCQHNRYHFDSAQNASVNNVTWINTFEKSRKDIGIIPTVTVDPKQPGVFVHVYPTLNQTEPWTVISKPHPDFAMMLWCGENPVLKYAGGILLSKSKNYADMPKWVEEIFREAVAKHGLDWDKDLFINDNSACEDDPTPPADRFYITKKDFWNHWLKDDISFAN